jgi:hypothetical protein
MKTFQMLTDYPVTLADCPANNMTLIHIVEQWSSSHLKTVCMLESKCADLQIVIQLSSADDATAAHAVIKCIKCINSRRCIQVNWLGREGNIINFQCCSVLTETHLWFVEAERCSIPLCVLVEQQVLAGSALIELVRAAGR